MTDKMPERIWAAYIAKTRIWGNVTPETHPDNTQYVRADLVRGNVDVALLKTTVQMDIINRVEADLMQDSHLLAIEMAVQLTIDHLAANGRLNAGWKTGIPGTGYMGQPVSAPLVFETRNEGQNHFRLGYYNSDDDAFYESNLPHLPWNSSVLRYFILPEAA